MGLLILKANLKQLRKYAKKLLFWVQEYPAKTLSEGANLTLIFEFLEIYSPLGQKA